ncbi:MAG: hypothetical protein IPO93_00020 [Actinobacteria bacterium]|nr:hypothetical protein [Actinomycetota bacterium]
MRIRGDGNLRHVEVPLGPGLNALVGLNGAGKSRILRILGSALTGAGTSGVTTHLVFRLVEGDTDSRTRHLMPSAAVPQRDEHGEMDQAVFRAFLAAQVQEALAAFLATGQGRRPSGDIDPDLARLGDKSPAMKAMADLARAAAQAQRATWIDPVAAATSLEESGLLAWVQEGRQEPELWAAVDPRTESPSVRILGDLHDAWSQAEDAWDNEMSQPEQDWVPEFPEYQHYGSVYTFDPLGVSPALGEKLPVPVLPLGVGRSAREWPAVLTDSVDLDAVMRRTRKAIGLSLRGRHWLWHWMDEVERAVEQRDREPDGDWYVDPIDENAIQMLDGEWPPAVVGEMSRRATSIFGLLYPDAPVLECHLDDPAEWLMQDNPVRWKARDSHSGADVGLAQLSASQIRWARLALHLATSGVDGISGYALFDEPEAGLHRTAQLDFARGLSRITRQTQTTIIVATHSPLLAMEADNLIQVWRGSKGEVQASAISADLSDQLTALGLLPEDLLAWGAVTLVVEGIHDKWVVETVLGEVLGRTRTHVLAIGGLRHGADAVTGEMLGRFTSRPIVVLIDKSGKEAEVRWRRIVALSREGKARNAIGELNGFRGNDYESRFLRSMGHELLRAGTMERVTVVALSAPDILDLLPESAFGLHETWGELRQHFQDEGQHGEDFKAYLLRTRFVKMTGTIVHDAALALDEIPDDLIRLGQVLHAVTDRPDDRV